MSDETKKPEETVKTDGQPPVPAEKPEHEHGGGGYGGGSYGGRPEGGPKAPAEAQNALRTTP
ncbi:MAG: hypothetical protein LIO75_06615, partial [Lachnospiraceae bacterium]|nr:hypothetical protein [Lachnospiraceae bacterium]